MTNQVCRILFRSIIGYHNLKVGFALIPESLQNSCQRIWTIICRNDYTGFCHMSADLLYDRVVSPCLNLVIETCGLE